MIHTIIKKLLLTALGTLLLISFELNGQNRLTTTLQTDWKFTKGSVANAASANFDDTDWQTVQIPHDWAIAGPFDVNGDGNTGKLPWKGEGWYRKNLDIPGSYQSKRIYLIFDGVMAFPKVYINGKLAGTWDYGYNSFYLDITDLLNMGGKNILAVHADTRQHDSRWYPGAGIYRKVQMVVTSPVHVEPWGTYITTPIIKPNYADVRISATIRNQSDGEEDVKVEQIIVDPQGNEVGRKAFSRKIKAGEKSDLEVTIQLTSPQLWDVESPNMYKAKTRVFVDNKEVDSYSTSFGIRSIKFTADDGFHLNGRRVQLKGVNLHHDHGPLGAAFNVRAMERQLEIMKSMGVNAVRNSHNVAAPELLELCDKMGILMFNEIFDKYDGKAGITENTDFEEFAHRNIRNFVVRDRNHPSVFLWSVGNEIGDVQWNINNGFKRLHTMVNYVNKYDPTRPVTMVTDNMESATMRHFDYYDVHSWNYGRRYRLARQIEPNKSVIISESASTLSTRGYYELTLPEDKTEVSRTLQVSSYDLNAPSWAEIADDDFMWQQDESYIAGEFVWTGFDYLGEPTPYMNTAVKRMGMTDKEASRSSYFGIVDLVGIPKDRYYLYKSYWKPEEDMVHILPHWNWQGKEGEAIPVFAYTNGDCAELFVNGVSQGSQCKKPSSKNSTERFRLMWKEVEYEPGQIKVVAYKAGQKIAEETINTAGKPHHLKLSADRSEVSANGSDLSYVLVEAYDKDGNLCPLANNTLQIELKGPLKIEGVGNGDPQNFEPFQSSQVKLFYGKAMIILGTGFEKGSAQLTVKTEGMNKVSIPLEVR